MGDERAANGGEGEDAHDEKSEEMMRPSADLVHDTIRREGEEELQRPVSALAWSGLAAGLSMSLSMLAEGLIRAALPDEPWRPLLTSFGYPLGFLVVVLGRQQLFTENTLTPVLPLLETPGADRLFKVLRLWLVVLLANLVGTVAFALLVAHSEVVSQEARDAILEIGQEALERGFGTQLLKGVLAGWMVALMAWLLPAVGSARVLVIGAVTYFISLAKLAHIVAGSADTAFVAAMGEASWADYLLDFVVPALAGNIVGGVVFVALLNHLQVHGSGSGADA